MPKLNNRLKELQQRAAALAQEAAPTPATESSDPEMAVEQVSAHFGATLEHIVGQRQVRSLPIGLIAPDLRPEMRQPRLLPTPDELLRNGQPVPEYRDIVNELLGLGQSLRERQIQPIVVYPGRSQQYPGAQFLILVGQRRWTAANLVGLTTIDAIEVPVPALIDRIQIQFAENEDREEFSDMERAWTLQQMKQALNDAPWEDVETRLQMSRARRQQLLRLLAFSPTQQHKVAQLRLQETQLRTLHASLRNEELTHAQADAILFRLEQIASERAAATTDTDQAARPRRVGIDAPTIARLVARTQRTALPTTAVTAQPTPRWLQPLREQLLRTNQSVQRANGKIEQLSPDDASSLIDDITDLVQRLTTLLGQGGSGEQPKVEVRQRKIG